MEKILEILKENSRVKPKEIARMLGRSESSVEKKIKELEENDVILKYKALINWDKVKNSIVSALIEIRVTPERGKGFDAIARRIYNFPEVKSLYLMSGTYDFLAVAEGKDMKKVALFVAEKLATISGVQGTVTHFLLKRYKEDGDVLEKEEKPKRLAVTP